MALVDSPAERPSGELILTYSGRHSLLIRLDTLGSDLIGVSAAGLWLLEG